MKETCSNCWLWEPEANKEISQQANVNPLPSFKVGKCEEIILTNKFVSSDDAILADDEGGCWAALYTAEQFGCNLWKEKE